MAKYSEQFIKKIQHIYETTDISLNKLAQKEAIGKATIIKWSQDYNWSKKEATDRPEATRPTDRQATPLNTEEEVRKCIKRKIDKSSDLNDKEKLFCHYYIRTFNGSLAVRKAGYSEKFPDRYAYTLLKKEKIRKYINELQEEIKNNVIVDMGNVIDLMKRVAFADIGDFIEFGLEEVEKSDGSKYKKNYINFKNIKDVDGQLINEISMGKDGIKVKLANKEKALEFLAKYMDYPDKLEKEKFGFVKEKYDEEIKEAIDKETNSKNIIDELIGKADSNAKNNNS